ncbi:hypothetical protein [Uliginosibacterium gangwonense]|uniref:hypothetical protein n=1 Tax=Uliginosibacterium gangwonense TaxID=392736 RepID=UPI0003817AFF|nr:hypothetical protein [Uliginosibacterium gangwonense]
MGYLDHAVAEHSASKRVPTMEQVVTADTAATPSAKATREAKLASQGQLDAELESVAILGYN